MQVLKDDFQEIEIENQEVKGSKQQLEDDFHNLEDNLSGLEDNFQDVENDMRELKDNDQNEEVERLKIYGLNRQDTEVKRLFQDAVDDFQD